MASNEGSTRPEHDGEGHGGHPSFPQYPRTAGGPPSIVSSRMTDIASDEGEGSDTQQNAIRSGLPSEAGASRPGTARTGISSSRGHTYTWSQSQQLRRGLSGARRGSGTASSSGPRPPSSSHVPSLTSHAFFHPMSSQKLQAQRGGPRLPPGSISRQNSPFQAALAETSTSEPAREEAPSSHIPHPVPVPVPLPVPVPVPVPNPNPYPPRPFDDEPRPMSHGTEYTSNTSPTRGHYGHYPQGSLSESMRPLQSKGRAESKGLSVNTNAKFKSSLVGNMNLPTPRSFRSSFLLPGRGNREQSNERDRDRDRERDQGPSKLDSTTSTPQHSPTKKSRQPKTPSARKQHQAQKKALGKNYQYFEGNTIFCFGGRLQNTRQARPVNLFTGIIVITPAILFFIFSAPWIWSNISPAIPVLLAYIFYICISSFIHASAMDPGVLPRRLHKNPPPDENEDPLVLAPPSTDWVLVRSPLSEPPPPSSGEGGGQSAMEVPVKYCKTCQLWRPPRAHHCRLCDSCIETVDHHCVWINNCVGRRNYRQFFTFIVSATIGCLFILSSCLAQVLVYMNRQQISFGEATSHFPVPFALVFYALLGLAYPLPLTVYHLFLIRRGETTREFLSGRKLPLAERYRPFTLGAFGRNLVAVLCRPRGPSYYQFKKGYVKGDQRLAGEKRQRKSWVIGAEMGKKSGNGDGVAVELREFGGASGLPARDGVGRMVTDLTKDADEKTAGSKRGLFGSFGRAKGPMLPR